MTWHLTIVSDTIYPTETHTISIKTTSSQACLLWNRFLPTASLTNDHEELHNKRQLVVVQDTIKVSKSLFLMPLWRHICHHEHGECHAQNTPCRHIFFRNRQHYAIAYPIWNFVIFMRPPYFIAFKFHFVSRDSHFKINFHDTVFSFFNATFLIVMS